MYIAHVRETDKVKQTLKDHLFGASRIAEAHGAKLGLKHVAGLAGVLHDLGKFSDEFQDYLDKAVFHPELAEKKRGQVDHSTAGGKLLFGMLHNKENTFHEKLLAEIVGNAIISHHSNLQDYISPTIESNFLKRVLEKELAEYELAVERFFQEVMTKAEFTEYVTKAVEEIKQFTDNSPTQSFFLTKYIFSCLIDADRTDTRMFEEQAQEEERIQHRPLFEHYYQKLMNHLTSLKESSEAKQPINVLRSAMSEQCESFAKRPSGIYTLSIPTGGGKTLASLRYALKHAQEYEKQRIIYVVPFTTIIEQNAQEVRGILEDNENILEHHSNVIEEEHSESEFGDEQEDGVITKKERLKLARDNWDSPIIFTTLVQFLNVFYAKGNRNTRRLHNLSHSVLIFDEVQKVPTKCVSLFNEALNFLKKSAHCSILLCTATQPSLENVKHGLLKERDGEIVPNLTEVSEAFKRVEIIDKTAKPMTNEELAEWIRAEATSWGSTLVILNTKSVVKNLYEKLKGGPLPVFHLSTSMCAAHRKEQLNEIRTLLQEGTPFICVTTQLIEAGVDVSFKCVIRSLAGLDSIAQAAGRCNRHGEDLLRYVYVIDHAEEKLSKVKEIEAGKEIAGNIFANFKKKAEKYEGNLLSQAAMRKYFQHYYNKMDADLYYYVSEVDKKMTKLLMSLATENSYVTHFQKKHGTAFPLLLNGSYKTAADHFRVIDQHTTSVIVPYGDGRDVIAQLNSDEWVDDLGKVLRKAQQYTVNLYSQEIDQLKKENALVMHLDGMVYELKESWYHDKYGVDLKGEGGMEFTSW
ncbi:CRISPR-associated helicase/endonuclease Cas3 [Alkalihalobacillus clausii]|uniref:CRISPR-associated helicase/endonuclease Cas3 n=1 Tax=Shouchella clausii TaxID=79880 RepID=UPI000BA562A5|nr:CRISPR-associated helicase/endonuclease Cas3 [Shouchella clausii]MCM3551087.1 CRISPR-associated helicase/endonuclease Cas3 [Shouchella clausii]PAF12799.1 CRISPR-associated helicase/endonuclease Cas3 [Shouchella clausii]